MEHQGATAPQSESVKHATCPFCGAEGLPDKFRLSNGDLNHPPEYQFFVRCIWCAADGPVAPSESSARKKWNRRNANDDIVAALLRAYVKLNAYVGVCKDDKELPKVIALAEAALAKAGQAVKP